MNRNITRTLMFLILVGISFAIVQLCKAESIYDLTKAIEWNPNDADAYYRRGKAYYEADLKIRAITDFTAAIQLKPDFVDAYLGRARAYTYMGYSNEKGRYDLAIADCTKAIELNPDNADAYYWRGTAYLQKDDYDNAIADYTKAIEFDPNNADAYDSRSVAYDKAGDYVRAAIDWAKMKRLAPDTTGISTVFGVYRTKTSIDEEEQADTRADYAKLIAGLTKLIQSNPDYALAYCARGKAYYERSRYYWGQKRYNDYVRARADFTKAIELDSNYAYTYYLLGDTYSVAKYFDNDPAIANYTKAIQLKPDYDSAYDMRARAYVRKGDYTLALVDRTILIQMVRNSTNQSRANSYYNQLVANAYDNRADVYFIAGDYDGAIADYTKAMEFDSDKNTSRYRTYRHKRGWTYHKNGNYDLAIADFTEGIQSQARYSGAEDYHYMTRGVVYLAKADYDRAIADFTQAIERYGSGDIMWISDPVISQMDFSIFPYTDRNFHARRNPHEHRGKAYLQKGDFDNAIADFTKVLEFYPQASDVYKLRGDAYLQKGDFDRSAADYIKANSLRNEP